VKQWPIEKVKEFEKYLLENNDIVLAMDRTWVKTGIKYAKITDMDTPCLLVQRVARLRCMEALDVDYLYFLIGSKFFEDYVLSIQTGLGVPHISGKQIQSFIFQKPSLKVQKEIIIRLKALSAEIEQLTKIYQEKLNTLDELKKSILQKAFTGELTKEAAT
jgi:type I restriction enzyme S subunit